VELTLQPEFRTGAPRKLFEIPRGSQGLRGRYDLSADGRRFYFAEATRESSPRIIVAQSWHEQFRDREQDYVP